MSQFGQDVTFPVQQEFLIACLVKFDWGTTKTRQDNTIANFKSDRMINTSRSHCHHFTAVQIFLGLFGNINARSSFLKVISKKTRDGQAKSTSTGLNLRTRIRSTKGIMRLAIEEVAEDAVYNKRRRHGNRNKTRNIFNIIKYCCNFTICSIESQCTRVCDNLNEMEFSRCFQIRIFIHATLFRWLYSKYSQGPAAHVTKFGG